MSISGIGEYLLTYPDYRVRSNTLQPNQSVDPWGRDRVDLSGAVQAPSAEEART